MITVKKLREKLSSLPDDMMILHDGFDGYEDETIFIEVKKVVELVYEDRERMFCDHDHVELYIKPKEMKEVKALVVGER